MPLITVQIINNWQFKYLLKVIVPYVAANFHCPYASIDWTILGM